MFHLSVLTACPPHPPLPAAPPVPRRAPQPLARPSRQGEHRCAPPASPALPLAASGRLRERPDQCLRPGPAHPLLVTAAVVAQPALSAGHSHAIGVIHDIFCLFFDSLLRLAGWQVLCVYWSYVPGHTSASPVYGRGPPSHPSNFPPTLRCSLATPRVISLPTTTSGASGASTASPPAFAAALPAACRCPHAV